MRSMSPQSPVRQAPSNFSNCRPEFGWVPVLQFNGGDGYIRGLPELQRTQNRARGSPGGRTLNTASAGEQRPLGFIFLMQPNCHDLDNSCKHSTNTELTVPDLPWLSSEPSLGGERRLAHGWPWYHGIWERGAETSSRNLPWVLCPL